jgi:hypothetical protein
MKLSIDTTCTLAVNNDYMIIYSKLLSIKQLLGNVYGESKWRVNEFRSCK